MHKVAIVTGASRGIGEVTAQYLGSHGYRVYGTSRAGAPPHAHANVQMLALDVTSAESVEACVSRVIEREGRVDLLVNNAGFPMTGSVEEIGIEEVIRQFDTNYFGALRMIHAVLPRMREQGAGHIVNVSSAAADIPVPFYGIYGSSKAALERMSLSLRSETRPFGIRVACVTPSSIKTQVQHVMPALPLAPYEGLRTKMVTAMEQTVAEGADPLRIAKVVLRAASSARPRAQYRVGADSRAFGVLLRLFPIELLELLVRKRFALSSTP